MTGEESTDFFFSGQPSLLVYTNSYQGCSLTISVLVRLLAKKNRQLEGYDLEVNLNPILSMDRPPGHPATGVTPLYAFFMSNRPDKGIAFKSSIWRHQIRTKIQGENNPRWYCLSTFEVQWWLKCNLKVFWKIEEKLYLMVQTLSARYSEFL